MNTFKSPLITSIILVFLISCSTIDKHKDHIMQKAAKTLDWKTSQGQKRLMRSQHKNDFFELANNFESQENKIYCALASSAIVLNSLMLRKNFDLPVDSSSIQNNEKKYMSKSALPYFKKFTQGNVLNKETKKKIEILGRPMNIQGKMKKDFGVQLHQLAKIIESNGAKAKFTVVHKNTSDKLIKSQIIKNLNNPNDYILVNYSRKALDQPGGGHVSPLGAYDKESDSFLIMDVNPNKAPWVWVKANDLIKSMRTFDTIENRGYISVSL